MGRLAGLVHQAHTWYLRPTWCRLLLPESTSSVHELRHEGIEVVDLILTLNALLEPTWLELGLGLGLGYLWGGGERVGGC